MIFLLTFLQIAFGVIGVLFAVFFVLSIFAAASGEDVDRGLFLFLIITVAISAGIWAASDAQLKVLQPKNPPVLEKVEKSP